MPALSSPGKVVFKMPPIPLRPARQILPGGRQQAKSHRLLANFQIAAGRGGGIQGIQRLRIQPLDFERTAGLQQCLMRIDDRVLVARPPRLVVDSYYACTAPSLTRFPGAKKMARFPGPFFAFQLTTKEKRLPFLQILRVTDIWHPAIYVV